MAWGKTGSWVVQGDSLYDYVRLPLTQRLPYRSQLLQNPTRLVLDVFGAASNTNWITSLSLPETQPSSHI
jgi:N-acetylmuramoyl-L-alanine amidase